MSHIIVGFICIDIGVLLGWCLRVALTRAQQNLPTPAKTWDDSGLIARWK